MATIRMVPTSPDAETVSISSKTYSVLRLCLAAHDLIFECGCGECEIGGPMVIDAEHITAVCEALTDICSQAICAGLRDFAVETAFLLSALPDSRGVRAEMTDA